MANLIIQDEIFGELLNYIKDDDITDINYNGSEVWVDDLNRGRYKVEGLVLSEQFLNQFATKLCNLMNQNFNKHTPLLEAETDSLRVSIIHESVTNTGKSISIRKTPAVKRLNREKMIKSNYCTAELDNFMQNAVKAGCNIIIAGLPGVGKTEYLKALTTYIPASQKVITVEDNLEIRYHQINPGKDCVEIKVGDTFSYVDAIKASMRQLPKWILLSEARSTEVKYLLESMSTGTHCLTTIHTDDVRKIPDRIRNMMAKAGEKELNDIYSFLDIGVQIVSQITENGITRKVAQVALLSRHENKNKLVMLYENGGFVTSELPPDILRKFRMAGINDPFQNLESMANKKVSNALENCTPSQRTHSNQNEINGLENKRKNNNYSQNSKNYKNNVQNSIQKNEGPKPNREKTNGNGYHTINNNSKNKSKDNINNTQSTQNTQNSDFKSLYGQIQNHQTCISGFKPPETKNETNN